VFTSVSVPCTRLMVGSARAPVAACVLGCSSGWLGWPAARLLFLSCIVCFVSCRLMLVSLSRRHEDDRDHYSNERLDLGGPLLAGLFQDAVPVSRFLFVYICF